VIDRARLAALLERERASFLDRHPRSRAAYRAAGASLLGNVLTWMNKAPFLWSEQEWILLRWSRTVLDHLVAEPHPFSRAGPARKLRCPPASRRAGSLTTGALPVRPGR